MKNTDIKSLENLREQLLKTKEWPLKYMFKFIVPNNNDNVNRVVALLPKGGNLKFNNSKDMHYVAVTCVVDMPSADNIIEITKQATAINGVMSL